MQSHAEFVTHSYVEAGTHSYIEIVTHSYVEFVTHSMQSHAEFVTHLYVEFVTHSYVEFVTHSYIVFMNDSYVEFVNCSQCSGKLFTVLSRTSMLACPHTRSAHIQVRGVGAEPHFTQLIHFTRITHSFIHRVFTCEGVCVRGCVSVCERV